MIVSNSSDWWEHHTYWRVAWSNVEGSCSKLLLEYLDESSDVDNEVGATDSLQRPQKLAHQPYVVVRMPMPINLAFENDREACVL